MHRAIHSIAHIVEDHAERAGYPVRFAATKLVEGDQPMIDALQISENEVHIIDHIVQEMEGELGTDREAALADMRYTYIEGVCAECVFKHQETLEQVRSEKIDRILTHKYFGIPIFLGIMLVVFYLTFSVLGAPMQDFLGAAIDSGVAALSTFLTDVGVSPWAPLPLDRRRLCRGGQRPLLPAHHRPPVLLPLPFGGQRLYGTGGLCHG